LKLTVIGCGDAFSSGGRLQASFLLETAADRVMIDCGATTLVGLERLGIDPDSIPHIVISHLHGDHFGGLIWLLMRAAFNSHRKSPLYVYGPPGLAARVAAATEALYEGIAEYLKGVPVHYVEIAAAEPFDVGDARVTALEVNHPTGAPSFALRLQADGKTFAYSGDTEWVEALVDIGQHADLYLMECYRLTGAPKMHLSWEQIAQNINRLGSRRFLLTHMSHDMLRHRGDVVDPRVNFAEDGAVYEF
jgi:ribonuclease BN (tRNA processing enzyme)